ncbi:MAG: hypothetical protein E7246_02960 [Lachnoclostridium sp.]|nr:hypothetical protein [Lachnoclostridium sp.]
MRMFGMLAVSILTLALSGCKDSNETKVIPEPHRNIWEDPDGSFTIPLDESEWKVEEESNGELHFLNNQNEKFSFSISKWENLQFPEDFDYDGYYAGYVEDIRLEFPDVVETGVEITALDETEVIQMGVRYEVLETLCQVTTSMVAIPDSEDTLCFVAIYPAENSKEQETEFKNIVTGIRFELENE